MIPLLVSLAIVPAVYDEWSHHRTTRQEHPFSKAPPWASVEYLHEMMRSHGRYDLNVSLTLYQKFNSALPHYIASNRGMEGGVYLRYIIDNYRSSLPDFVAFLHAYPNEHSYQFPEILTCLDTRRTKYTSLNRIDTALRLQTTSAWGRPDFEFVGYQDPAEAQFWMERCWRDVLAVIGYREGKSPADGDAIPSPIAVSFACCNQFVVSKEMIRRLPLKTWKKLHTMLAAGPACHLGNATYKGEGEASSRRSDPLGRGIQGFTSEHLAHVIYGGYSLLNSRAQMRQDTVDSFARGCKYFADHGAPVSVAFLQNRH